MVQRSCMHVLARLSLRWYSKQMNQIPLYLILSLVLVQPRKTFADMTEKSKLGRKELKKNVLDSF